MPPEIYILVLGAFLAAFVVGAAGFGDALVAAAVWLHVFEPTVAAPLIVMTGLTIHVIALARLYRELDFTYLAPFLGLGALGVPLGTWLLAQIEAEPFRLAVGALLFLYGGGLLLIARPPVVKAGGKSLDAVAGGIGGVLGGLAGMSGAVPAVWCGLRGWPKEQARGVAQPYILAMHVLSLAAMAWAGLVTWETGERFLWGAPAILVGTVVGIALYRRLNEQLFRKLVLAMLAVSGLTLVI
ncbi:MAG: sulfite exporter TauE/SafE family protein [Magnetovibrio sp.]|nr:sulfite exporter TauE/SafE family protein [Magnetovibrio sp.]